MALTRLYLFAILVLDSGGFLALIAATKSSFCRVVTSLIHCSRGSILMLTLDRGGEVLDAISTIVLGVLELFIDG